MLHVIGMEMGMVMVIVILNLNEFAIENPVVCIISCYIKKGLYENVVGWKYLA